MAVARGVEGARHRQELVRRAAVVLLIQPEQGQAGVLGDLPGVARCQEPVLLCGVLDLRIAVAVQAHQAYQVIVAGAAGADVERGAVLAVGIQPETQLLHLVGGGRLAHLVDHAAWGHLAVHHGRRTLEHFNTLQVPAVEHAAVPLAALWRAHPVEGDVVGPAAGVETADAEIVDTIVDAAAFQADTGHIAHCIVERLHAARIQLGALDHRHRLGCLGKGGAGLGGAAGAVGGTVGIDADGIELSGALRQRGGDGQAGKDAGQGEQIGTQSAGRDGGGGHGRNSGHGRRGRRRWPYAHGQRPPPASMPSSDDAVTLPF